MHSAGHGEPRSRGSSAPHPRCHAGSKHPMQESPFSNCTASAARPTRGMASGSAQAHQRDPTSQHAQHEHRDQAVALTARHGWLLGTAQPHRPSQPSNQTHDAGPRGARIRAIWRPAPSAPARTQPPCSQVRISQSPSPAATPASGMGSGSARLPRWMGPVLPPAPYAENGTRHGRRAPQVISDADSARRAFQRAARRGQALKKLMSACISSPPITNT